MTIKTLSVARTAAPTVVRPIARTVALVLATTAVYAGLAEGRWRVGTLGAGFAQVQAQSSGQLPASFSVPSQLPGDAVLRIDGSSSMVSTNEALRDRFLDRFPTATVELDASRTDAALAALTAGQLDIVAAGRPLTAAERSQGLVAVPLEREKIAIIVGPENPFSGSLTFEQFARIFRGEITDWSDLGGAPGPIRLVDRPDYSDTRRALGTYQVFQGAPFEAGATADPVASDDTEAVIKALGTNGISYAVASQTRDRRDLRILAMHQILPDDPRYPYSQPRAYVYNGQNPTPVAVAFLGLATTAPGQEVVETVTSVAPDPAPTPPPNPETALVAPTPSTPAETVPVGGFPWWLLGIPILGGWLWWLMKGKSAPVAVPVAAPIAAPIAPPLAAAPERPSRIILTPRNCRRAYAYWEVPNRARAGLRDRGGRDLMLRLFDVTHRDADHHPPVSIEQYPVTEAQQDLHLPIPQDDRDYQVELGYVSGENHWLTLAKSDPVRVPVCAQGEGAEDSSPGTMVAGDTAVHDMVEDLGISIPPDIGVAIGAAGIGAAGIGAAAIGTAAMGTAAMGAGTMDQDAPRESALLSTPPGIEAPEPDAVPAVASTIPPSSITLTPRNQKKAYAAWDTSAPAQAALKAQGSTQPQLRIYDVTGIDLDQQPAHSVLTYAVDEDDRDRIVPIPQGDRDYLAEIGYVTNTGIWLPLARSAPLSMAGESGTSGLSMVEAAVTEVAVAGATGLVAESGVTESEVAESGLEPDPETAIALTPGTPGTCAIETVTLHSRHNAFLLDGGQMQYLQDQVAATYSLDPGFYIVRIKDGAFNYGDDSHPGEPWVLLWIYGGKVANLKTQVWVNGTWSTLNGYADTLSLEVDEPAQLCAFFIDTFPENNTNAITLSVVRL